MSNDRFRAALVSITLLAACDLGALGPSSGTGSSPPGGGPSGGSGSNVGSGTGSETTVPDEFGVLVEPRLGETGDPSKGPITLTGYHSRAGETIAAEVYQNGAWTQVGVTVAASAPGGANPGTDPDDAKYPFQITFDATSMWPKGGLLQLRVSDSNGPVGAFFDDSATCIAAQTSWRDRIKQCGAMLDRGVVLTSTDGDPDGFFHAQRFLDDKGFVFEQETDAYYESVDAPETLDGFYRRYIQADLAGATYFNKGDLGIGREMTCGHFQAATGQGVGCAVSNYGQFDGFESEALEEALQGFESGFHDGAFATVAMVYTPPIDAPNAVQFFVYDANQDLQDFAQLDAFGDNESVPDNCLTCHASNSAYARTSFQTTGAHFLPFDPLALDFADVPGFRRADQEDQLRQLNLLFMDTSPSVADAELVNGLYGGSPSTGTAADDAFVPDGWQGPLESRVYQNAIAPYCRGCHASRADADAREVYDFSQSSVLAGEAGGIAPLICTNGDSTAHRMPDAEVTQRRFWSGNARAYLAAMIDLPMPCTP